MIASLVQFLFFFVIVLVVLPGLFRWVRAFGFADAPTHEPLPRWVHDFLEDFQAARENPCYFCKAPSLFLCGCSAGPAYVVGA